MSELRDEITDPTTTDIDADPRSAHRHDLDPVSLAFGVIFAGLGLLFLIGDVDVSRMSGPGVSAAILAALGCILLALGIRRYRG